LPHSKGWYTRAILVNLAQLLITLATARLWIEIFGDLSLFKLSEWQVPLAEGFIGWFFGTGLLLLVAPSPAREGLVACVPPNPPLALEE
jgi:hypothetical protein